jgi:hypothetical protein
LCYVNVKVEKVKGVSNSLVTHVTVLVLNSRCFYARTQGLHAIQPVHERVLYHPFADNRQPPRATTFSNDTTKSNTVSLKPMLTLYNRRYRPRHNPQSSSNLHLQLTPPKIAPFNRILYYESGFHRKTSPTLGSQSRRIPWKLDSPTCAQP